MAKDATKLKNDVVAVTTTPKAIVPATPASPAPAVVKPAPIPTTESPTSATDASKDPPKTKIACELCEKEFEQYDGMHVCPDCVAYANKKRDYKRLIQFAVTVFSAIQAALLAWLNSLLDMAQMSVEGKILLAVTFAAVIIGGISELAAIYGKDKKELEAANVELKHKLDLNVQEKNLTKAFNMTLVERLAETKE